MDTRPHLQARRRIVHVLAARLTGLRRALLQLRLEGDHGPWELRCLLEDLAAVVSSVMGLGGASPATSLHKKQDRGALQARLNVLVGQYFVTEHPTSPATWTRVDPSAGVALTKLAELSDKAAESAALLTPPTLGDLTEAVEFLEALNGGESGGSEAFAQILDDPQQRDRASKAGWHGAKATVLKPFDNAWLELVRSNIGQPIHLLNGEVGAFGIFAMANVGDGTSAKGSAVTRVRALFGDDDEGELDWRALPARPSIVVRSRRGVHFYWLVADCPLQLFRPAQLAIAKKFGTDDKVTNLSRVMRLPGFLHAKDPSKPFRVRLEHCEPGRIYSVGDLAKAAQ